MNNSSAICNLSLSTDARDKLVAILSSGGFAGVLSCSMALVLLIFFKMYKTFSERLVLYLLLSGLFLASMIALMITGIPFDFSQHHSLCQAIAFLLQYSIWILLLLTTFIVFHLAALVFFFKTLKKIEVFCVIFSLLFPLLISWVPFLHDTYGLAGAWCWIRVYGYADCRYYREGLIEQYALWYGPFFLLLIVNAILTIAVLVVLCRRAFRKQPNRAPDVNEDKRVRFQGLNLEADKYKKALRDTLPLLAYPIIYNFFSWFTLANRIRRNISPGSSFAAWVIHAVAAPTWAFFVGVAFIVYVIGLRKLSKHSIKRAYYSWKQSFAGMRRRKGVTHDRATSRFTDVLTAEGYTVTCPTAYEPPRESEDFENLSYHSYDSDAAN